MRNLAQVCIGSPCLANTLLEAIYQSKYNQFQWVNSYGLEGIAPKWRAFRLKPRIYLKDSKHMVIHISVLKWILDEHYMQIELTY